VHVHGSDEAGGVDRQYRRWSAAYNLMRQRCAPGVLYAWAVRRRPDALFFAPLPPLSALADDRVHGTMRCSERWSGTVISEDQITPNMIAPTRRQCAAYDEASRIYSSCSCVLLGCATNKYMPVVNGELVDDQVALVPRAKIRDYFGLEQGCFHKCLMQRIGANFSATSGLVYTLARAAPGSYTKTHPGAVVLGGEPDDAPYNATLYLDSPMDRQSESRPSRRMNCTVRERSLGSGW
jgi:hypothetical protein